MIIPLIPKEYTFMDDEAYEKYLESWNSAHHKEWRTLEICGLILIVCAAAWLLGYLILIFYLLFRGF